MKSFLARINNSDKLAGLVFIIFIAALTYLPLANQLGYYRDDWHVVWGAYTHGPGKIIDLHTIDRPFMGFSYAFGYLVVGDNPLGWQLYAFLLRLGGGIAFYWLMCTLWPKQRLASATAAILFLTYPGFLQLPNANAYHNHLLGFGSGVLSIALTARAITSSGRSSGKLLLGGLSVITGLSCYLIMEYMVGLEGVRLVIIWYLSGTKKPGGWRQQLWLTVKNWLPNLLAFCAFLFWRVFVFKSARSVTDVGELGKTYTSQPVTMIIRLVIETVKDFIESVFLAWAVPFYRLTAQAKYNDLVISVFLALAGVALLLLLWRLISQQQAEPRADSQINDQNWPLDALWVGGLCALVALTPAVLANRQVLYQDAFDRYTLPGSIGAAIVITGLIFYLFSSPWRKWAAGALLFIAIITHFNNAVFFRDFWEYQRQVWWQLSWRAPDLKKDTALIVLLPNNYRLWESYEIWGPANLIYSPLMAPPNISGEVLNSDTLISIMRRESFLRSVRRVEYTIDFENSLLVELPAAVSCAHIIDGQQPVLSEFVDPMIRLVASHSNIDMIDADAAAKTPPGVIFGKEPEHTWCYYYQKASLARQRGDWQTVGHLGDEAMSLGLAPTDDSEWIPFYEGYAHLRRFDEANKIGALLRENYSFLQPYCDQFKGYQITESSDANIEKFIIENICGENWTK